MKNILTITLLLGSLNIFSQSLSLDSGETYAVVIGISDYQDEVIPDLRFADKDALAFAGFLQSPAGGSLDSDHLKVLINEQATAGQVHAELYWLVHEAGENDQVIIYFSGHGDVEQDFKGQPGFLLCWDAPSHVYMAGGTVGLLNLQVIISTLSLKNKAKVTMISDACRAGKLSGSSVNGSQLTNANLATQFANEIKILSCQANEFSHEGEQWGGGRGAFSYHLLDGLYGMADGNEDLSVNLLEIGRYLEDNVSKEVAPESQIPMTIGNRGEQLTTVFPNLLQRLKEGRRGEIRMFSPTETRGIEIETLALVDSTTQEIYAAFKRALKEKQFLEPVGACADAYYEILIKEPKMERLHVSMRRNYAAALQDDAQQVINNWMKTSLAQTSELQELEEESSPPSKVFTPQVKTFPVCLERAAELLGREHYMYPILQARKHFFKGYLLTNSNRKHNEALGNQALASFRQALTLQPDLPQAYWQMSLAFGHNLLQPDSAEFYARKAIELSPYWATPYTDLTFLLSRKYKQFDRAKTFLNQAMQLDSNSFHIWKSWGTFYNIIKEYSLAEKSYQKVLQLDSNHINVYNDLGMLYKKMGRYDEAEQQYRKLIQGDSTIVYGYKNLGNLYRKTGRYEEAIEQYKKAIAIDSNYIYTYLDLGHLYRKIGKYKKAMNQYEKSLQLDSTYTFTYNNMGILFFNMGRYGDAEQCYNKVINLDSTYFHAYHNLGNVYMEKGNYTKAKKQYEKALQLDSTYVPAYGGLGDVGTKRGNYEEAKAQYNKAIQLDSTFLYAYSGLGMLYHSIGKHNQAKQFFEKALQLDSTQADIHVNFGMMYTDMKRFSEAEEQFKKAIQLDSTRADSYNNLGNIYLYYSRLEEAENLFKKSIQLHASNWVSYSNLGIIYQNLQRWEEAASMTQKAIDLFPNDGGLYGELAYALSYIPSRDNEVTPTFEKAIKLSPDWPDTYLYWAQYLLRKLDLKQESEQSKTLAYDYLQKAFEKGVGKNGVLIFQSLKDKKEFEIMRKEPIWKELMQKYFSNQHKK